MFNFVFGFVNKILQKEMKKIIIVVFLITATIGIFFSCNDDKTYAQRLDEEKKAIERFIDENDIQVLREYPKDSVFQANEFYFDTSSGIYYNVIDSGNGRRIKVGEEFYIRFKGLTYIASTDTFTYSNIQSLQPEVLVYGNTSTYSSVAWVAPLKNVGDRAKVKLIVPFNMGLPNDQQGYKTAYYEELKYRFEQ
jgi:hypothetical protein